MTGDDTFHASAQGGFRFITGASSVTYISGGSTGWSTTSTRAAKTNIDPVDPQTVLAGVEEMAVSTWEYTDEDGAGQGVRHIGPMAEDFHEAVNVDASDDHINSINADGVAFAAIQGLAERLEAANEQLRKELDQKADRIAELEAEVDAKTARIEEVEAETDALRAENEQLRDQLEAFDERLASVAAEARSDGGATD